ncbi:MAG: universal stress protein [Pseudomonadota bacterium]|nr:universal stress protein [Xanthomonadaceae bacterium]MDE2247431.1 universal stress protein [Xanthomonadaceae bacterium]MDE3210271.1 universal stress protein [Pseudomonadota bacterium]
MFKNILLPVDGSELSLRAVDTGLALAVKLGASVYAFHIVPPYPALTYFVDIVQANQEFYLQEAIARGEGYLQEVERRAKAAGVPCGSGHEIDSRPHRAIIAAVARQQCDLIVMASHGLRGVDRLLLGSETQKVLVEGDVPVLVCH